ncbi:MAG: glycosyltransferase family 4 protein [Candidatus Andersenbacteria bacterium]
MKLALYFEWFQFADGWLFKGKGSGLPAGYKHQVAALRKVGVPFHEGPDTSADILQLNVGWPWSAFLMWLAHRRGRKVVMYAHSTAEDSIGVFKFVKYVVGIWRWYLKRVYGSADILCCPSAYTRELMITQYGIRPERARVVTNGVDTDTLVRTDTGRTRVRAHLKLRPEQLMVGTVGLVVPRKGVDTFVHVAEQRPDELYVWCGAAFAKANYPKVPESGPGSNLRFPGYVDVVLDWLSAMDIFLFPSHEENQGIAILEAASLGLPIVVRDLPAYRGWLQHEKNCLIAKREEDFGPLVARLVADPALRERLGREARKTAEANDLRVVGGILKKIYAELLQR